MLRAFETRVPVARSVLARGSHPLPDLTSVQSGREALAVAAEAREHGRPLVLLLSGGASAMLAAPVDGVSLDMKREATRRLLVSGADIHELNAVRKHLSQIKGGRLGVTAVCTTFALSDVADDDPATIGSGPAVGDPSTVEDAIAVLERYGLAADLPEALGALRVAGETPKPGDPGLADSAFVLIGGRRDAMDGAVTEALARGYATIVLDEPITGDASTAGAGFARRAAAAARRIGGPAMVVASGETTVRVRGQGIGGRNQEFALGAAIEIAAEGAPLAIAAFGTDGIDGNSPAAGAIADPTTVARGRDRGLDAAAALHDNDSYHYFQRLGDLIVTGPTGTNVGDVFVAIMGT
jgi:glycerate 2-kinase